MGYTSSTSFAMPLSKIDTKKSAKSTVPSGIPSAAISSTRSGKERILTDYYQKFSKKAGSRSLESSKGAAEGIPEGTVDLADFLLSTLERGIAKLVDKVYMEDTRTYRSRLVIADLKVAGVAHLL